MMRKIETNQAPAAIGPYSQAIGAGDFVFVSGQLPINPETGMIETQDVVEQAVCVFKNISAILTAAGCTLQNVVKATVFLKDMNDFTAVNRVYAEYFCGETLPARAAVEVARLPRDVRLEIEVIAYCGN